jgi:AcrR family transcriptional regulator
MADTRDRILDAAAHVMRTRGFARTTTKEIARAAGYSEATLYKHFTDKTDLFLAVLKERLPSLGSTLSALSAAIDADTSSPAGPATRESLASRLAATARGAIAFYEASFPISASVFSEPESLARYLRLEQERGRIRPGADCDAAASLLLGSCFQYAFLRCFAQLPPDPEAAAAHVDGIAATLLAGLEPA